MRKIVPLRIMVWLLVVAICVTAAQAKQTTLCRRDHGVLGAMHREGCQSSWLSEVSVNGERAEWVNFRNVAKNARIDMPDACGEKAPAQIAKRSKLLQARDSFFGKLRREKNSLAKQLKDKNADLTAANSQLTAAKLQILEERKKVVDLAMQLEMARKASAEIEARKSGQWWLIAICSAEGVLLVLCVIWISSLRRERAVLRNEFVQEKINTQTEGERISDPMGPETYVAHISGKKIEFRSIHHAKCPYCSEDRLTPRSDNLRQHVEKVHPEKLEVAEPVVEEAKSA